MSQQQFINGPLLVRVVSLAGLMALCFIGCVKKEGGMGANSNAAGPQALTSPSPAPVVVLEAKEPERYAVTTLIKVEPRGNTPQANVPPLKFSFAKSGNENRRVSFVLPDPAGEVIYLEKGSFKYLIFPARNQYVELDPNELGFQLGNLMSPASIIERLKERTQYENMGTESLNGRMAIKYRFKGSADTRTQAGTVAADSVVYVDQETGLPLRSEVETTLSNGAGAHLVTETDSIQLTPETSLFDVPTTMKKVTTPELKQQIQGFANMVRVFAAYLREQAGAPPAPAN